ncbi:hypothetical protein CHS0354_020059 [Potamilus streckersoni]|uniref:Acireductone dioxygenase n=1 Tax=Potamilus streckersoni TaxID=2493646 RepID=A0AAE0VT86_9BIVA|nr:hypothetical protein CHS0354_020059 [Potamilus streckersoni]
MVRAWYMDDDEESDQRLPHMSPQLVDLKDLEKIGVLYWKLDADNYKTDGKLKKIREERGYTYEDNITCCPEKLPNYEQKIKTFYEEHLHTDEEIRFILDGSGYFDVRDANDRWIRIEVIKGDLIVLPAGIYHRFTLDKNDYIHALRLFVGEPVWTPYNRPADDMQPRIDYVRSLQTATA